LTRPVDDFSSSNHQIMHGVLPPLGQEAPSLHSRADWNKSELTGKRRPRRQLAAPKGQPFDSPDSTPALPAGIQNKPPGTRPKNALDFTGRIY
jgi:hypothetical protein